MAVKYVGVASPDLKSSSLLPAISRTLEFIYTESLGLLLNFCIFIPTIFIRDDNTTILVILLRSQNH